MGLWVKGGREKERGKTGYEALCEAQPVAAGDGGGAGGGGSLLTEPPPRPPLERRAPEPRLRPRAPPTPMTAGGRERRERDNRLRAPCAPRTPMTAGGGWFMVYGGLCVVVFGLEV